MAASNFFAMSIAHGSARFDTSEKSVGKTIVSAICLAPLVRFMKLLSDCSADHST
jgi:hypothetical protein